MPRPELFAVLAHSYYIGPTLANGITIPISPIDGVRLLSRCSEAVLVEPSRHASTLPTLAGRILLADDGIDNQGLLSHYLRKAGAAVFIADNGRIAYDEVLRTLHADAARFDLILMDMQMPELDGYGATTKIRAAGFTGPIVALTAHVMAAASSTSSAAPADSMASCPSPRPPPTESSTCARASLAQSSPPTSTPSST